MPGVKTYFEKRAAKFDSLYERETNLLASWNRLARGSVYKRTEYTLSLIRKIGHPTILDVGCGSGRNSLQFAEAGAKRVHGIDFSRPMLELARAYAKEAGLEEKLSFEEVDFLEWETEQQKWDLVVALGFFDYFADILPLLRKMHQLSNKAICFSIRHPSLFRMPVRKLRYRAMGCPIYFYRKDFIELACRDAGFAGGEFSEAGGACFFVTAYK